MAMTFDEFRNSVSIRLGEDADELRQRYIQAFVDVHAAGYIERVQRTQEFTDGRYYIGYLWDYLKQRTLISEDDALSKLTRKATPLHVLWDLHSSEMIRVPNYWRFPKYAVLDVPAADLIAGLTYLPEDIYVFDDTFEWSIILTHEDTKDGKRWCLESRSHTAQ